MNAYPLKEIAPWTQRIIWINVIIAVIGQIYLATKDWNPITTYFSLRIGDLFEGKVWGLFTYMWVHADFLILHVIFNMMSLYFLGRIVEYKMGSKSFMWLYLLGGLTAVGFFMIDIGVQGLVLGQTVNLNEPLVGASGAVCAVLGAFSLLVPDTKLVFLFIPYPIRAVKFVQFAVWFSVAAMVLGWLPAIRDSQSFGWFFSIAHSAHLGGILLGWWFMVKLTAQNDEAYTPYRVVTEEQPKALTPVSQMKPSELRQALDPILDKISSKGIDSLTEREMEILRAGRKIFD